jgi:hypothetical protein
MTIGIPYQDGHNIYIVCYCTEDRSKHGEGLHWLKTNIGVSSAYKISVLEQILIAVKRN